MKTANAILLACLIASAGFTGGILVGYARWHETTDAFSHRRFVTLNRAANFPDAGLLAIGDSTIERQYLKNICNLPVFNAGLSSGRSDQILPMLPQLIKELRPSMIVVGLGANDVAQSRDFDFGQLKSLPKGSLIVGVTSAKQLNGELRKFADSIGHKFVEPIPETMTSDGIHLNKAGQSEWVRRVEESCS